MKIRFAHILLVALAVCCVVGCSGGGTSEQGQAVQKGDYEGVPGGSKEGGK